jgi:hypothetical protein
MIFCASHFDGVSTSWGVDFSIWKFGTENRNSLDLKVKDFNKGSYEVEYLFDKEIFNLDDNEECSVWVRKEIKGIRTFDRPQLSSGIIVKQSGICKVVDGSLGYFYNNSNNIMKNSQNVGLFSDAFSAAHGLSIIPQNFLKVVSLFTARKSITGKYANWINDKDEYMAPNESHPLWQQFQHDSLVYSLFNTSSNQSSLRQIKYKEKLWDIKNEFFWMSKEQMMELSEKKYFDDIYRDARSSDERYVYTLLHKEGLYEKLSPDAKEVLDMATELVKKTFDMREILHNEHPEYHLNTWDAGWYQIKLILKQFYADDLKIFTKKYKEFEDRMRPLVYELGFLRK